MKRFFLITAILFITGVGILSAQQTHPIKSTHVKWHGYKVVKSNLSAHYGTVEFKSGKVELNNEGKIVGGNFVVDLNTISTQDLKGASKKKLDDHLKGSDFFEVAKYPIASFKITEVKNSGNKEFPLLITGLFTIKGKTYPESFKAKVVDRTFITEKISLDRKKYDIVFELPYKDRLLNSEIDLEIKFKF